jgi:drug/metabolite transporter (DMT)-like permease
MSQVLLSPAAALPGSRRATAVASLLLATSAWGSLFFVGKHVLRDIDALWFTTVRYSLAALVLLLLHPFAGPASPRRVLALAPRLAGYGLAGYGVFSLLVFIGLSLSVPSHGAVIMATMPVSTVLLRWALDGLRPSRGSLVACALALAGVTVVSGIATGAAGGSVAGDVIAFAGTFGWIVYTRGAARFPQLSAFEYTAGTAYAAAPALVLVAIAASAAGIVPWPTIAALAGHAPAFGYVAVLPTVVAAVAFNQGVRVLGAATGTLFINVVPISALAIATALGHPPAAHEWAGAALVGAALVMATRR